MSKRRTVNHEDAEPDTADETPTPERDTSVAAAIERVLAHAESHGEAYVGAVEDHTIIRAALSDGRLTPEG